MHTYTIVFTYFLFRLRDAAIEFMEEKYEEMKNKLPAAIRKTMKIFNIQMHSENSENLKNNMSDDIKISLYNGRP